MRASCAAELLEGRRLLAGVPAAGDATINGGQPATPASARAVEVIVATAGATPSGARDDLDDQISEAIAAGNAVLAGQLSRDDDVDMYSVVVSAGDVGSFSVIATPDEGDPVLSAYLRLFDGTGGELASDGASFDYFFGASGTYFVGVSEAGNAYDPVTGDDTNPTRVGGKYALTVQGLTVPQAPVVPAGPEFRVNTHTPNTQAFPATAMDADGDFVVTWQSRAQDQVAGANDGVYAQRYNAAGFPQGPEFLVNTTVAGNQTRPQVAMDAAGDFVIAWESPDASVSGIYARRYNAAGVAQGPEFPVNTTTADRQLFPAVAMDGDGDFVVAWQSYRQDLPNSEGVYAQRYSKTGATVGAEFKVNTQTASHQRFPTAAMDAAGNFVIAWSSDNQDPDNSTGIYAQRYDAAGVANGVEFRVNSFTTSDQFLPSAAMGAEGDFVVTWHGYAPGDSNGVYARRYDAAGVAQGADFQVNTFETSFQRQTAVAMDADGDFVIAWQNEYGDFNAGETRINAQRYASGGARAGGELTVNTTTLGNHRNPAVAMDADGEFVVAWAGYHQDAGDNADQSGIYAQRYAADRPAVTGAEFRYQSSPHRLRFTFNQDVSASLAAGDLSVTRLGPGGGPVSFLAPAYDAFNSIATFAAGGSGVLPNGNYRATISAAGVTNTAGVPMAANYVLDFFALAGDIDRNRMVDSNDFVILASNFGKSGRTYAQGDLDGNGTVNSNDFVILAANFGKTVPAPPTPPALAAVPQAEAPAAAGRRKTPVRRRLTRRAATTAASR